MGDGSEQGASLNNYVTTGSIPFESTSSFPVAGDAK